MDSRKFFTRKYVYNVKVETYKKGFNVDLSKNVSYLDLSIENNEISPFKDYFMEAGDAIFVDNTLFLNYKEYIVSFIKESNIKKCEFVANKISSIYSNQNKSLLPFDFEDYKKNSGNNRYKFYSSDQLPEITKLINSQINEFPINLITVDNGGLAFQTYIMETDGDSTTQILINIKDNKVLAYKIIGFDSDNNSSTFIINNDLSIDLYKLGKNNSKRINSKLQINQEGLIIKVK